ncbi:MAG TPA: PQQ-binding-like beta-propeller repeat protein [Pyrinomonadaceae bacterium]|jgi:outer membrane protein assembly factor BamB|nr:PQQ-binding-like beta-propeller repeat protein [Pyrinomonadaceae bacterium]
MQVLELVFNRARVITISGLLIVVLTATSSVVFSQGDVTPKLDSSIPATVDLSQPLTVSWRFESNLTLNLTPAADGQRIYLPLAAGTVVSLMATNGQLNWRSEMGGELSASPIADQRAVYVASETGKPESGTGTRRATGALRALGREGGVTQWMRTLAMPLRGGLTLSNGKLFGGGSDGKIYAFESTNGEARWAYDYGSPFNSQPVVAESRVYIGSEDGVLLALDEASGKLLWHYRTKGAVRGPVASSDNMVYFGSDDGYVYALNATNGRLVWRKRTGAGVQAVVRVGDELLAASLDNFVYRFSLTGARSWKRRLPGRIASQPFSTPSAALFMPFSSTSGVVLELRDGRQVNLLPLGEEITTSASPIAVGEVVLLTTEHGLLAFAQPKEKPQPK